MRRRWICSIRLPPRRPSRRVFRAVGSTPCMCLRAEVRAVAAESELPDWLQEACLRIQEPDHFTRGVPAFVALCGRSHEHVSRLCRSLLGKTPTQLVNDARLARAAVELRTTAPSITDIALDCGFEDPGSFYKLFKARFGTTPRRYRSEG